MYKPKPKPSKKSNSRPRPNSIQKTGYHPAHRNIRKMFTHNLNKKNKPNIVIGIATYNRNNLLERLLNQIDRASKNYNVSLIILDDGSPKPVKLGSMQFNNIDHLNLYRSNKNHGKKEYWITVNFIFDKMSTINADYYYYFGDDAEIEINFFDNSIDKWNSIKDNRKISLNLINDSREECWTNFKRIPKEIGGYSFFLSQWLDMQIMFDSELLKYRVKAIDKSRWRRDNKLSSGVGRQLSRRFYEKGYHMYQVKKSLIKHSYTKSVMNPHRTPEEDKKLKSVM